VARSGLKDDRGDTAERQRAAAAAVARRRSCVDNDVTQAVVDRRLMAASYLKSVARPTTGLPYFGGDIKVRGLHTHRHTHTERERERERETRNLYFQSRSVLQLSTIS